MTDMGNMKSCSLSPPVYVETPNEVSCQVQSQPQVYFAVCIPYSPWWILQFSWNPERDWSTVAQKYVRGAQELPLAFGVLEQQLFATRSVRGSQLSMLYVNTCLYTVLHLMGVRSLGRQTLHVIFFSCFGIYCKFHIAC